LEDLARRHNEETASLRSRMWERATYYGLASDPPDDQKWCLAQNGPPDGPAPLPASPRKLLLVLAIP
jgi:hypothetical protein